MDVFEAIKTRRSVRGYKSEEIPEETLLKVLEAARLAPSAHNAQDWRFVVVKDPAKRQALADASGKDFIGQAPVVIAAVGLNPENMMSCGNLTYTIDLAIAVDHMTLEATELGLGTCWIGAFDEPKVKEILDIPQSIEVIGLMTLGYFAEKAEAPPRVDLEKIVHWESWFNVKRKTFGDGMLRSGPLSLIKKFMRKRKTPPPSPHPTLSPKGRGWGEGKGEK